MTPDELLPQRKRPASLYDRVVQWMDKNEPENEEFPRFRAEASRLLELKENQ